MYSLQRTTLFLATLFLTISILLSRDFAWVRALFSRRPKAQPINNMDDLHIRLQGLGPSIERLMEIAGTPGVSIGVISKDSPPYLAQCGVRDVEASLPIDPDTIFASGSLTKAVTAAAIGILVDEGKASWDTLVKDVLPEFQSRDETLQNHATLTDILSHRTGMSWADNLWIGTESNILISSENAYKFINNQTLLSPFRAQFGYSNLCYELAGHVVEAFSGQYYFDFVKARILDPLDMKRTFFKTPPSDVDSVYACYNTLDDKSTTVIHCAKMGDDRWNVLLLRKWKPFYGIVSKTGRPSNVKQDRYGPTLP